MPNARRHRDTPEISGSLKKKRYGNGASDSNAHDTRFVARKATYLHICRRFLCVCNHTLIALSHPFCLAASAHRGGKRQRQQNSRAVGGAGAQQHGNTRRREGGLT